MYKKIITLYYHINKRMILPYEYIINVMAITNQSIHALITLLNHGGIIVERRVYVMGKD